MVYLRKRFGLDNISAINEMIAGLEKEDQDNDDNDDDTSKNKGPMLLDATCAPSDIRYPTDLGLLGEAREKTEKIIDTLFEPFKGTMKKPRTYRQKARKRYLAVSKKRKVKAKQRHKAVGQQLRYLAWNFKHIEKLQALNDNNFFSEPQQKQLSVIKKLYEQQKKMHEDKSHSVKDRIVSISKLYVRPIVRGKVKSPTELGAKIKISLVNGYTFIENLSWDNYHEGNTFIPAVENYKRLRGYYPAVICADAIYRNRDNLRFCKEKGIRLSGPRLVRPPKHIAASEKRLTRHDSKKRNEVEPAFGEGKRRYGLNLVMAKLQETSETVIALPFLVMNLERRMWLLYVLFSKSVLHRFKAMLSRLKSQLSPVAA